MCNAYFVNRYGLKYGVLISGGTELWLMLHVLSDDMQRKY